MSLGRKL